MPEFANENTKITVKTKVPIIRMAIFSLHIKASAQSRSIKWSYKTCKYNYDSASISMANKYNKIYHFHTASKIKLT